LFQLVWLTTADRSMHPPPVTLPETWVPMETEVAEVHPPDEGGELTVI
jgi:hypothetical protein